MAAQAMAIESDAELMAFFSANEFADEAVIENVAGGHPITGNFDTMAQRAKPGGVQNSSQGPFIGGAAEFAVTELQFTTDTWRVQQAGAKSDDTMVVTTGRHAGQYRIKEIQSDGDICRLLLNEL